MRTRRTKRKELFDFGEMFGASTGDICQSADGTRRASVLLFNGTFLGDRQVWDDVVGENRFEM